MAKRQREPIRVESYITIGGIERNLAELNPEQRSYVGACLRVKALNAMFVGRAVFSAEGLPPAEEVFPELRG